MNEAQLIALVDHLRALPSEMEWLEFKRDNANPQMIGEYLSALANEACLRGQPRGYLIFGVDDLTHDVVGTQFDPYTAKAKGNQHLLPWLSALLTPNPGVEPWVLDHPAGRVVVLAVGPAQNQPVCFAGKGYGRTGASKVELSSHPEKQRSLWTRGKDWSAEVCEGATLDDLDPSALATAREQFRTKHPAQAAAIDSWDTQAFLNKARLLRQGAVTNTALVLLGRSEAAVLLSPSVAKVSWVLKDDNNLELDYVHIGPPLLLAGEQLLQRIRNLTVRALPSGTLFPTELSQYDTWVLREAIHNAIAHQDYRARARITVVEFPDRVLITNAGDFLPGSVRSVIEQDAPQLYYRNPFLADAMVELNLIDTQGGGIKRMFETQRRRSFPLPDFDLDHVGQVGVSIPGRILDERYTRILMEQADLTLSEVMLLDQVQKKQPIAPEDYRRLRSAGLAEGRFPSIMVSGSLARATGNVGRHIRERGLDKQYYLDLLLALLKEHGPVTRADVDQLLLSKLPERLSQQQKRNKVRNLLQELRQQERIANAGTRREPRWLAIDPARESD